MGLYTRGTIVPTILAAVFAAACAGASQESEIPEAGTQEAEMQDAEAPAGEAPSLSDPEVAHVAVTANTIDIELARLAESQASDPAVRQFARTMITDHTAVNEQAAALAERLGVTPQDNAVSQQLQAGAEEARRSLEGLSGAEFDRAYMEREVAYHEAVLDALDGVLIPETENAELRALLEGARPAFEAHLESARSIRESL